MWRHKNEEDERGRGKEKPIKKEMENPQFLWRHTLVFVGYLQSSKKWKTTHFFKIAASLLEASTGDWGERGMGIYSVHFQFSLPYPILLILYDF